MDKLDCYSDWWKFLASLKRLIEFTAQYGSWYKAAGATPYIRLTPDFFENRVKTFLLQLLRQCKFGNNFNREILQTLNNLQLDEVLDTLQAILTDYESRDRKAPSMRLNSNTSKTTTTNDAHSGKGQSSGNRKDGNKQGSGKRDASGGSSTNSRGGLSKGNKKLLEAMSHGDIEPGDGCFTCGSIQNLTKKAPKELIDSVLAGKSKLCERGKGCSKANPTDAEKREGARHKEAFDKKKPSSSAAKTSVAAISISTPSASDTSPTLDTVHTAQQMNKVFFAALSSQQGEEVVVDLNSEKSHYGDLPSTEHQALKREVAYDKSLCIQLA